MSDPIEYKPPEVYTALYYYTIFHCFVIKSRLTRNPKLWAKLALRPELSGCVVGDVFILRVLPVFSSTYQAPRKYNPYLPFVLHP